MEKVKREPQFFGNLSAEEQTPERCRAVISVNGDVLAFIKNQTPELCIAAIQQWGPSLLRYVKHQTQEICLAAIELNGVYIYENDIVSVEYAEKPSAIGVVKCIPDFAIINKEGTPIHDDAITVEVIGNIYENPDLRLR